MPFNKFLIFVDEAGDHLLRPNYPEFPLFVLAFCIIERDHYANFIVPELLKIKLRYFEDSHIIFHERDIRKAEKDFRILTSEAIRSQFFNDLNEFMANAQFKIISSVIRKDHLQNQYNHPDNPYELATAFCLERLLFFLNEQNEPSKATVSFEARGKREDAALELSFLRLLQQDRFSGRFGIKILPKIANCSGLQLADLIARPIGRHVLNPQQTNRSFDILRPKIRSNNRGEINGYGLKIFP